MRCIKVFIFILVICASCSKNYKPPENEIHIGISSQAANLDPRFATDAYGSRISSLLFNSFVNIGPDFNYMNELADKIIVNEQSITIEAQKDIYFNNGRKLNIEDINFSFEEFRKETSPFYANFKSIQKVEIKEDDKKFYVKLNINVPADKFLLSDLPVLKLLPKKEIIENPDGFKNSLIGTGSYKIKIKNDSELILTPNKLNKINPAQSDLVFKIIRDDFTRFQKLLTGEIDLLQDELPLSKISSFKNEKFNIFTYPGLSFSYLLINHLTEPLKNLELRRALSLAINRNEIINHKLEGYGKAANSILTPENQFYNRDLSELEFKPKLAQEIIGKLNSLKLNLKTSTSRSSIEIGKILKNYFETAGAQIEMRSYEWGTYYHDIKNSNFDLAIMRWVGVLDPDIFRHTMHSNEFPPGRNRGKYINKTLDQLLVNALKETNLNKRKLIYKQIQEIALDQLPIIPLWYNHQVAITNKAIKNYQPSPNGDYRSFIKMSKKY